MAIRISVYELEIAVYATMVSPESVNLNLLYGQNIVPSSWRVLDTSSKGSELLNINFDNDVNILVKPGVVNLSEELDFFSSPSVEINKVVSQLLRVTSDFGYQSMGINPRIIVTFNPTEERSARDFIVNKFLAAGPWLSDISSEPVRADIELFYSLIMCQFRLSINEAKIKSSSSGRKFESAVLLSGNFTYEGSKNIDILLNGANNCIQHLETYRGVVDRILKTPDC